MQQARSTYRYPKRLVPTDEALFAKPGIIFKYRDSMVYLSTDLSINQSTPQTRREEGINDNNAQ